MLRHILGGVGLCALLGVGCPPGQQVGIQGGPPVSGPSIIVTPSTLSITTGGVGEFTVALSADPGGAVTVDILCIAGGCGFEPAGTTLVFDSSNFSEPQTVVLTDRGFQGRGESVYEISGNDLLPTDLTVVRD